MNHALTTLQKELQLLADEKTKKSSQHFFKEAVKSYGVKTVLVSQLAKKTFRQIKNRPKEEILLLCEELWKSGYIEETFIACHWAYSLKKQYIPDDFHTFERWVSQYVSNWASCDTLCNHTIGTFLVMYPEFLPQLQRWTQSDNRWTRRAAAVSLIVPARKGLFLENIIAIAKTLLTDNDDLVRKGYGWMLKEASKPHLMTVFEFVMANKAIMPRTSLRYAIEKMPLELRKEAMLK